MDQWVNEETAPEGEGGWVMGGTSQRLTQAVDL
jgi:hypothetical protein